MKNSSFTMKMCLSFAAAVAVSATSASLPCKEELIRNGSFGEVEDGRAVGWPAADKGIVEVLTYSPS